MTLFVWITKRAAASTLNFDLEFRRSSSLYRLTSMEPPPRPGMRRKSSASNLLSSFQGSRNATSQTTGGPGSTLPDNASSFTETTATTASAASSLTVPPSSHESVRETINRRLLAIAHIRQSYEGYAWWIPAAERWTALLTRFHRRSHWLNTVMVDRSDLERTLNNHTMKKRSDNLDATTWMCIFSWF